MNANPQQNPPRLGTSAKFLVSYSQSPGPCSTLSTTMTVTGPNAQVKMSTAGGAMTYIGRKAGVERVKFTFGESVCSGNSDFNIVVSGRTEFNVVWGQDAWQMGVCAVDAVVPTPGDPAIIERTYNSTDDRGWFSGAGWSLPYLTTIGGDTDTLQFYGFDGQRFLFQKKPDGTWAPLNGQTVTLTQVSNTYTLKFVDGTVWTYSGSSLTSITKNGQATRVQPGLYGSTSSVTLANGKRISFSYDSNFNLSRITLPDGRFIAYTVNASGGLSSRRPERDEANAAVFTPLSARWRDSPMRRERTVQPDDRRHQPRGSQPGAWDRGECRSRRVAGGQGRSAVRAWTMVAAPSNRTGRVWIQELYRVSLWCTTARRPLRRRDVYAHQWRLFYDAATNGFAVVRSDGIIRTYFRPNDGLSYWKGQIGG